MCKQANKQASKCVDSTDPFSSKQAISSIMGRRQPGFFWLFAMLASFQLVSKKPCAIIAASWWVSGDGQCRDESQ